MSAMHWEARRRQNMLDRRMTTKDKQCLTEGIQKQSTTEKGQKEAVNTEPLVADDRIICQCQPVNEQYSTKTEGRYTSTQYSQQW